MIQRLQTVFLALIVVLLITFLFVPLFVAQNNDSGEIYRLYAAFLYHSPIDNVENGIVEFWPYILSGVFATAAIIVSIVEIFAYKNRLTQMKLGALNTLLLAGTLICAVWFSSEGQEAWSLGGWGRYDAGVFFPAISMLCNILANRFIRKDEKLVKSMDRIR